MKELIRELVQAYGPSGHEGAVRAILEGMLRQHSDELRTDQMGNLIAMKKGSGEGKNIMVAAHMDEIGLMVTYVEEKGFLRFANVGGVSPMSMVGSRVRFDNGTLGVIGWEKWMRSGSGDKPEMKDLFIDVGATSRDDAPVGVGDAAVFVRPFEDLGNRLVAKAMDDRVSCAVAAQALMEVGETPNNLFVVFTTQEEVGTRGAMTAAYGIEPDVALSVDVTLVGDTPGANPMAVSLSAGPAIKIMDSGMISHRGVVQWMVSAAEKLGIPYQREVLQGGSTDARAMQTSRAGVPAGCLSIPCRYVHTPSEMVDYADVQNSVKLLVELLSNAVTF